MGGVGGVGAGGVLTFHGTSPSAGLVQEMPSWLSAYAMPEIVPLVIQGICPGNCRCHDGWPQPETGFGLESLGLIGRSHDKQVLYHSR